MMKQEAYLSVGQAMNSRRSIKYFDPDYHLDQDKVDYIIQNAKLSPSAFHIQHWRFLIVQNKELKKRIREASYGQPQPEEASLLMILCADLKAWEKDPVRYALHRDDTHREKSAKNIQRYYEGNDRHERDDAMRSVGLVAMSIMLLASEMGLDSCPMTGFDFKKVSELIKLPGDYIIGMMIAIGKRKEDPPPRGSILENDEILKIDTF